MKRKRKDLEPWQVAAKIAMVQQGDMTIIELASQIGQTREHVTSVLNGRRESEDTKHRICRYLGIREEAAR
ncbi:MAG: XRE family transcriptional regulator [Clostridia bacterium]|nr:XRE family transcriptional regulator [Clostridia bacterium]